MGPAVRPDLDPFTAEHFDVLRFTEHLFDDDLVLQQIGATLSGLASYL